MAMSDAHRQERSFGISVGTVCWAIWACAWWRGGGERLLWLGLLGASLMVMGRLAPAWLRMPSAVWWKLSHALGWMNARVILSCLFFLVFTPVGLVLRLAGHDPLRLRRRAAGTSAWSPYPERLRNSAHYERMF